MIHFLRQHEDTLSVCRPMRKSYAREADKEFFGILETEMRLTNYPLDRKVDETGLNCAVKTTTGGRLKMEKADRGLDCCRMMVTPYSCLLYDSIGYLCALHDDYPSKKCRRHFNDSRATGINWQRSSI